MSNGNQNPAGRAGPAKPSRRGLVVILLLLALFGAFLFTQASCKATLSRTRHLAACTTCGGTGVFGKGKCPTCSGIGYIKVSYSYPVISPGKAYPDDRLSD